MLWRNFKTYFLPYLPIKHMLKLIFFDLLHVLHPEKDPLFKVEKWKTTKSSLIQYDTCLVTSTRDIKTTKTYNKKENVDIS